MEGNGGFGPSQLFLADSRLALVLVNHLRHKALQRMFGVSRDQANVLTAVLLLGAAKLAGTALVARIFQLTQPALMQLPFFARWYTRWKLWKDGVMRAVRAHPAWRAARSPATSGSACPISAKAARCPRSSGGRRTSTRASWTGRTRAATAAPASRRRLISFRQVAACS